MPLNERESSSEMPIPDNALHAFREAFDDGVFFADFFSEGLRELLVNGFSVEEYLNWFQRLAQEAQISWSEIESEVKSMIAREQQFTRLEERARALIQAGVQALALAVFTELQELNLGRSGHPLSDNDLREIVTSSFYYTEVVPDENQLDTYIQNKGGTPR